MFLVAALLAVGCEQAPVPVVPKKIDPKASFARVLAQLKDKFHGFDDISLLSAGDGVSRRVKFSYVVDDVSGEVTMRDDSDSAGITARVSVRTSTSFTPLDPYIDSGSAAPSAGDTASSKGTTEAIDGVDTAAADRLAAKRANARVEEEIQQRVRVALDDSFSKLGGEKTDVYDFAFESGRWVLTTEGVEESKRLVIDDALTFQ